MKLAERPADSGRSVWLGVAGIGVGGSRHPRDEGPTSTPSIGAHSLPTGGRSTGVADALRPLEGLLTIRPWWARRSPGPRPAMRSPWRLGSPGVPVVDERPGYPPRHRLVRPARRPGAGAAREHRRRLAAVPVGVERTEAVDTATARQPILVAGVTGAGKSSVLWSLIRGIAPAIMPARSSCGGSTRRAAWSSAARRCPPGR